MASRCMVCFHPARREIDDMLLDGGTSMEEITGWCEDNHPESKIPSRSTLSAHRRNHLQKELALSPGNLTLRDGQVIDVHGRPLESIGIAAALKALLTIGIRNALLNPERVSVKDTIEILRMMKSLGQSGDDVEELFEMWSSTVIRPSKKKKKGEIIEADVSVEISPTEEIIENDGNPWADVELGEDE